MASKARAVSDRRAAPGDPGDRVTIATHFVAPLARVLSARGVDPSAVFGEALGAPASVLPSRIGFTAGVRVWNAAVAATGDCDLGLRTAGALVPGDYGVLEYVSRASPTLRAVMERLGRYHRLVNDGATVSLSARGPEVRVRYEVARTPPLPLPRAYADFVLAAWVHIAREITGEPWPFDRARLPYPAPANIASVRSALAPTVEFGAPHAELYSPRARLDRPLPRADVQLTATLDQHAERLIARARATVAWRDRVAAALRARLAEGTPRLAAVARTLEVPERALRRHLENEGTSFAAVLDNVRRSTAVDLLQDATLALGEIAFLLGFSEPSAFHRAYRRWTGRTPRPRTA